MLKLIERDFGSFEAFAQEFKQAAATQFGSGWAWLAGMYCHFCIIIYDSSFCLVGWIVFQSYRFKSVLCESNNDGVILAQICII